MASVNQSLMRSIGDVETSLVESNNESNEEDCVDDDGNTVQEQETDDQHQETDEERVRREMEESERLCWQLMQVRLD